jgi:hypothetical protein
MNSFSHSFDYVKLLPCIVQVTPEKRKRLFNYYTYTEHADNVGESATANERKLTDEITLVSLQILLTVVILMFGVLC